MDQEQIEDRLDKVITELRNAGADYDELISAFEMKLMMLKEEQEGVNQ